jgi:proteasome lid subunit RPN8/RPN11
VITLTDHVVDRLKRAYSGALPHETCGLLLGYHHGLHHHHAVDVVLPAGAAGSRDGFELCDHEIVRMTAHAVDRGLAIVALFHSHPSQHADLSEADLAAIRYSQWPWLLLHAREDRLDIAAFAAGNGAPIAMRWPTP